MARLRDTPIHRADPDAFLMGDGYSYCLLSGVPLMTDRQVAAQAWERLRGEVWAMWLESAVAIIGPETHVPHAARHFDGLAGLDDADPEGWAAFRARRPDVAPALDAIVSTYRAQLRTDDTPGGEVIQLHPADQ